MGLEHERMRLERLRAHRVREGRAFAVGPAVEVFARGVRKRSRAEAEALRAWGVVVPGSLGARCVAEGLRGRVLTVRAADQGVRWRVDEWLRGGGLDALRGEACASVARVRVLVSSR